MKIFISIFAIYFLGLSFAPIIESLGDCSSFCQEEKCEMETESEMPSSNDCSNVPCNTLCDCTCCINIVKLVELPDFKIATPALPSVDLPQFEAQITGILSTPDIWQPPRFS